MSQEGSSGSDTKTDLKRFGKQLQREREDAGLEQEEAAAHAGISRVSLSRYENGRQRAPHDVITKLRAFYERQRVTRGTSDTHVSDNSVAYDAARPAALGSNRVRVWLADFRAKLTRADVPDDQIDAAIALMTSPQALTYYKGGRTHDFTEDEAILELEGLAQVVIDKQKSLGRKFKS